MKHDLHKPSALSAWFTNLKHQLLPEPDSLAELHTVLHSALDKQLMDQDTFKMMEGVLAVSQMQVRDIMIPRAQMAVLEQNQSTELMLKTVIDSSHSRFPVIGENKDDVLGIVLVKDFLKAYVHNQEIDIQTILRPAHFVPESKRLDSLLNEFKSSHNHLAIVVDEYGGIAGLVTIEDILEEIVGDIEDEFDEADESSDIVELGQDRYQLHALLELDLLNEKIGTSFHDDEIDTIGGLLTRALGHIPRIGESAVIQGWEMSALKTDSRRVLQVEICKQENLSSDENNSSL